MAARGKVLAEWTMTQEVSDDDYIDMRRNQYAVREDGKIIWKFSIHYKEDYSIARASGWHDYGWKLYYGIPTKSISTEEVINRLGQRCDFHSYEKVK